MPRALRTEEIPGLIGDYRRAAPLAKQAGFDGVEVHAANCYLLEQFIRDSTNHRTYRYGGSIENRTRPAIEVVSAVAERSARLPCVPPPRPSWSCRRRPAP